MPFIFPINFAKKNLDNSRLEMVKHPCVIILLAILNISLIYCLHNLFIYYHEIYSILQKLVKINFNLSFLCY